MARTSTAPAIPGEVYEGEDARASTRPRRPEFHFPIFRAFIYLLMTAGAILFVMPFLWMASTSFMTISEVARGSFLPSDELIGVHPVESADLDRQLKDFLLPTATVEFDGVAVNIEYEANQAGGAFDVFIDNQLFGTVDTYSESDTQQQTFTVDSYPTLLTLDNSQSLALPDDNHTLQIVFNEAISTGDQLLITRISVVDGDGETTVLPPGDSDIETPKGLWERFAINSDGSLSPVTWNADDETWMLDGTPIDASQVVQRTTNLGFPDYFRECCLETVNRAPNLQAFNQRQYISQNRVNGGHAIWKPPFGISDQEYIITGGASHYVRVWDVGNFGEYFVNSVIITFLTVFGQTLFAILAAYAFARIRFPGSNVLFTMFLVTIFIPTMVTLIPNLLTVTNISRWSDENFGFKWLDNWPALVMPFLASTFSIFLLRQFFMQIPDELWDAAQIDGAGHFRFLFRVVVPISRAAITTVVLFSFIITWDALDWPLLVTSSDDWRPIAVGIFDFRNEEGARPNLLMAASMIALLPIIIVYFMAQRQFTEGIATSGLKG